VICNGALHGGGAMITFFWFCQNCWSWRLAKESWQQRIHVKPLMD